METVVDLQEVVNIISSPQLSKRLQEVQHLRGLNVEVDSAPPLGVVCNYAPNYTLFLTQKYRFFTALTRGVPPLFLRAVESKIV